MIAVIACPFALGSGVPAPSRVRQTTGVNPVRHPICRPLPSPAPSECKFVRRQRDSGKKNGNDPMGVGPSSQVSTGYRLKLKSFAFSTLCGHSRSLRLHSVTDRSVLGLGDSVIGTARPREAPADERTRRRESERTTRPATDKVPTASGRVPGGTCLPGSYVQAAPSSSSEWAQSRCTSLRKDA